FKFFYCGYSLLSSAEEHHDEIQQRSDSTNGGHNIGERSPLQCVFSHVVLLPCYNASCFYPRQCTLAGIKFNRQGDDRKQGKHTITGDDNKKRCINREKAL